MNAACPCSAHAQIALSFGSGDTSLSSRTSTNSASSLSRLMIAPTRFRRTPSLAEDLFVFRKNLLRDEPGEGLMLKPLTKKRSARILDRTAGFESRDPGDKYRGIDDASRLFSSTAQPLSPAVASSQPGSRESPPRSGTPSRQTTLAPPPPNCE